MIANVDQHTARKIIGEIIHLDGYFLDCQKRGDGISTKDTNRIRRLMNDYIMIGGTHAELADVCSYCSSLLILKNLIEFPPKP